MAGDLATFCAAVYGVRQTAQGGIGGECVDLANVWLAHLGHPPVHENAVDWVWAGVPGAVFVPNAPTNYPQPGAIVVWGPYPALGISRFGHIAVCVTADVNHLITLDQNWPAGSRPTCVPHSYAGVKGWFPFGINLT